MISMIIVISTTLVAVTSAVEFRIVNRGKGEIWIGIQGNPGHPHLQNGGFVLSPHRQVNVRAPSNWAGRFWARTWCNPGTKHCSTGDCGNRRRCNGAGGNPPVSLAEITLKGAGGLDYYDISLVDGFNIPIAFGPVGGKGDGGRYSCKRAACRTHINRHCPRALQLRNRHGVIVGCKSACLAFNTDQYCCRGAHDKPNTCRSSHWPVNYPAKFKNWCPDAYSYAYDDHKSTFTCRAHTYVVEFGG